MTRVGIDGRTGVLLVGGKKVFPIGFSEGPPLGMVAPNGKDGLRELAEAGATFVRIGPVGSWNLKISDGKQPGVDRTLDRLMPWLHAAKDYGLLCWLWLENASNLPARPKNAPPSWQSPNSRALKTIVARVRDHPGLGAYKGIDEPANPNKKSPIEPDGLIRGHTALKALDPDHPLVIIQAPLTPADKLKRYAKAFDITGADIFPISYPPGRHVDPPPQTAGRPRPGPPATTNHEISAVGDITTTMMHASEKKPVWMTLQIAWTGTVVSKSRPHVVPCFPSLREERFMAYQAIVNGARGLTFFGGHLTQVCTPADAEAGWNWTFWQQVLRPLLGELRSPDLAPALVAPDAKLAIAAAPHTSGATDIELAARKAGRFLYVIAVKRGGSVAQVDFVRLPKKRDGTALRSGEVLFEYVQDPPPRPFLPNRQFPRRVTVTDGRFRDWFAPHDVHIYRFDLARPKP